MSEISIKKHGLVAGRYKITKVNSDTGEKVWQSGWSKNLITNWGLNAMGYQNAIESCYVGSGNAPPQVTDTALVSVLARTTSNSPTGAIVRTGATAAPWWGGARRTWRFAVGAAAGNISEVGVGVGAIGNYNLFSRALILDGDGNPTTITVLANEFLDVTYDFRMYLPAEDFVFNNVNVFGNMHTFTFRGYDQANGQEQGAIPFYVLPLQYSAEAFTNGTLSSITGAGNVGGTGLGGENFGILPYVQNSLKRGWSATFGLSVGNSPTGISNMRMYSGQGASAPAPKWQIGINPPILKTNLDTLTITFEFSWARMP